MAAVGPLVGKFAGVETKPIRIERSGMRRSVSIPGMLDIAVEGIPGASPTEPIYFDNVGHPAATPPRPRQGVPRPHARLRDQLGRHLGQDQRPLRAVFLELELIDTPGDRMQCPSCQAGNPPGSRFCDQCGTALPARCGACGATLRPESRFCGTCGARAGGEAPPTAPTAAAAPVSYTPKHLAEKILKSRSALEGERRQVTVLFADMAGFTAWPRSWTRKRCTGSSTRCFELITAEVHRFEGTINQYTGDGVMALFGAPIAHEDSARRAVHAALGIQRALSEIQRPAAGRARAHAAMRIGLNTGPVVVGRIGDDLRMDYTAVGDTTNLAARMQQTARPGSVVVTEATHKAVEGFFETLDLGRARREGARAGARVRGAAPARRAVAASTSAGSGGSPRSWGASASSALLVDRFREAAAGRGQVVFVAGDAGIGKSRLLHELRRALGELAIAVTWLEGQCVSFGQSIPFLPLVDLLRKNFEIEEFDGEPEIIAKVEHGMQRMGELAAHMPFIRYLLSVDPGDPAIAGMDARASAPIRVRGPPGAGAARGEPAPARAGGGGPPLDGRGQRGIPRLADRLGAGVPLMLILTYRVGYTPPFRTRSFQSTLSLTTLAEAEALAVAGAGAGRGRAARAR